VTCPFSDASRDLDNRERAMTGSKAIVLTCKKSLTQRHGLTMRIRLKLRGLGITVQAFTSAVEVECLPDSIQHFSPFCPPLKQKREKIRDP
jgi:hypothetical protein